MPETTVAGIIHGQDNPTTVLLTRRSFGVFRGMWCIPGGHIDPYEGAREAAIREVKEETGLDFNLRFFRYFDEIIPRYEIHNVVLVFVGVGRGTPRMDEREVSEIGWFSLDEARTWQLAFTHNEVLDAYAQSLQP
jgi:8-oxo-dGTP diphosphatase